MSATDSSPGSVMDGIGGRETRFRRGDGSSSSGDGSSRALRCARVGIDRLRRFEFGYTVKVRVRKPRNGRRNGGTERGRKGSGRKPGTGTERERNTERKRGWADGAGFNLRGLRHSGVLAPISELGRKRNRKHTRDRTQRLRLIEQSRLYEVQDRKRKRKRKRKPKSISELRNKERLGGFIY